MTPPGFAAPPGAGAGGPGGAAPGAGTAPGESPLRRLGGLPGRLSVRARLTLTYGGLFFVAGAALILVVYAIMVPVVESSYPTFEQMYRLSEGLPPEVVENAQSLYEARRSAVVSGVLNSLLTRSALALVGVGILALILGYVVADRALRPLQRMTATARRLSESTLAHERIALEGPDDEIKELADTFDAMLARLNVAFDTQRRFVANASHELRTPLAINRTVLEVALADPEASGDLKALGRTLLGTNARNEKLIEGLLLLARSERELTVRKAVEVREVAETAVDQLAPFAAEQGVRVSAELYSGTTEGDPVLLERCAANLVENAIKYNVPDGEVWVRTGTSEGGILIQVANTGPHVPPYDVDDLFEPFRRLHADRVESARGAGLGLSIVRAVVRAHGGTVTAAPRDGGGLIVTVRLPAARVNRSR
ncbi:sensor histidine kinase [Bailinhaonella thermotolerans]